MKVSIHVLPAALTSSGTGAESFKILKKGPASDRMVLQLRDEEDNLINIVIDPTTLRLIGYRALEATSKKERS